MWSAFLLLLLAGTAVADYDHGWKLGTEYQYLVRSRTITSWEGSSKQYTGVLMKGVLTVQWQRGDMLQMLFSKAKYAHVHTELPAGLDSEISDETVSYRDLSLSGKPFEVRTKHGVVKEVIVDNGVPTWETNILKGIVSQLQVDTQGENAMKSRHTQVPEDDQPYGMFKAMEDSVGGKCEVVYDITPLPERAHHDRPDLVPMPQLKGEGQFIDIVKTKNYSRCEQRMGYHFGVTGQTNWEPGSNDNGRMLMKSSSSRIIISGNLKRFTIQSSVTTNKVFASPHFRDDQVGVVFSRMNLTLAAVNKISKPLQQPHGAQSAGNLVYTYDDPFTGHRRPGKPNTSPNSIQDSGSSSARSISSSEEALQAGQKASFRDAFSGSSASSSSFSSSEEGEFWQTKPKMTEAPSNPLLPYFIGYEGQAIWKSPKINFVAATKSLVQQIAQEISEPSDIPTRDTLETFTILASFIRTMNREQIKEIEKDLYGSFGQSGERDSHAKNALNAFRDAVTQAGTGPAFLAIRDWIVDGKIKELEAAFVVSRLPSTARVPTAEYMNEFFSLATHPKVTGQKFLNVSIILSFTDLVRRAVVYNGTVHNRYPVHTYGRLIPKHDQALFTEYIPYLAESLKSAIRDGDSQKIQVYIMALGNLGHPAILGTFEPYLEGKVPVTTFQRSMMVASLGHLAKLQPKLARGVLYKIYLNTMEAPEIRSLAVYLLMTTSPPFGILQRMAEFTNHDTSRQVNSAVKSSIVAAAGLKRPEWRELAQNARAVVSLLSPEEYGDQYSHSDIWDQDLPEKYLAYTFVSNYVGGEDSFIPKSLYCGLFMNYGGFKSPAGEFSYMVSSVKRLLEWHWSGNEERGGRASSAAEDLAKLFNFAPSKSEPIEGNAYVRSEMFTQFFPFDQHTLKGIQDSFMHHFGVFQGGHAVNLNKFISYDVIVSFPMETGLPFVYSTNIPILMKLFGTGELDFDGYKATADLGIVYSKKIQSRFGFVTPYDHQHFLTGVDTKSQIYAAAKLKVELDHAKKEFAASIWPSERETKGRFYHYSVTPYTSKSDLLDMTPVSRKKDTHVIHTKDPQNMVMKDWYVPLRVEIEADDLYGLMSMSFDSSPMDLIMFPWSFSGNQYTKIDVFFNPKFDADESISFVASYDSQQVAKDDTGSEHWPATAVAKSPDATDSVGRKKAFMRDAAKGIKSAKSYAIDMELEIPAAMKNRQYATLAFATSDVERKSRALFYWRVELPEHEGAYEACASAQASVPDAALLDYGKFSRSRPYRDASAEFRYGTSCESGGRITVVAKQAQTEQLAKNLAKSLAARKCAEEMKSGNVALRYCQMAKRLASTLDELTMTVRSDSKILKIVVDKAVDSLKYLAYPDVRVNMFNPKFRDENRVQIEARLSPELDHANVTIYTSDNDATFSDLWVRPLTDEIRMMLDSEDDIYPNLFSIHQGQPLCVLDNDQATTFDHRVYSLDIGECGYMAMTTLPQQSLDGPGYSQRVPEDMRVSVVLRKSRQGKKELKIVLGDDEVAFVPTGSRIAAKVNGKTVQISQSYSYKGTKDDAVIYEIIELEDGSLRLVSDFYELDIIGDADRAKIKVSDKYRDYVRGLCGNFDSDPDNDFTSPRNCVLADSGDFVATYAVTKDSCDSATTELARKASQSVCKEHAYKMSNVISDMEAGRASSRGFGWGYHGEGKPEKRCNTYRAKVVEKGAEICFTVRPVPTCAEGCSAIEMKRKHYQLHCMPRDETSLDLKRRIEQGANPDFSRKTPTRKHSFEVPIGCKAH